MATSGIGTSALDVNTIVTQLMTIEKRPLQILQQREATITSRIAAFSRVQGAVASLQTAAAALALPATWSAARATVSGEGVGAAVTDASKAAPGSYSIKVAQLANAQALASGQFNASAEVLGNGSLTLQVGSASKTITLSDTNNTLAGIRDEINAAKAGVTASIVNDGTRFRLTLVASNTGAANTVKITVVEQGTSDGDPANGDATGLSRLAFDSAIALAADTTAPGRNMIETRAGTDAVYEVNGLQLTSDKNSITGAIEGVTLNLKIQSPTATSTVVVGRDVDSMKAAVSAFVKAYNDVDSTIKAVTAFDATSRTAAILNGDSAVRSVQVQVRGLLRGSMSAPVGDYTSLSGIGLEVGRDGGLSLNSAKFEAAAADPAKLARLFTTASDTQDSARGFGVRFQNLAKAFVEGDGVLSGRTKSLQSQIDSIGKEEQRISNRLTLIEARLRKQYSSLDTQLSALQNTSSSLANALNSLPGAYSGK